MGLGVEVGILRDLLENDAEGAEWVQEDLDAARALLRETGAEDFQEPTGGEWEVVDYDIGPYSFLHNLRRVAAYVAAERGLPEPGEDSAGDDPVLTEAYQRPGGRFTHLIHHSDAEGYYLPVDFPIPLAGAVSGELVGSSVALRRELLELRDLLGIPHDLDPDGEELWQATEEQGQGQGWKRYGIESFVCVRLLAAAEASVRHGAALAFV